MTAPGLSPIYAAARDMLAALDAGNAAGHYFDGTLCARIVDGGNYRELTLADVRRIERDTLDTWAVAVGRPDGAWAIDQNCGGRVARLEWATDGEAPAAGGSVQLERFALRGAAAERELHETKQALAAMTARAEQAEREANSWIQAADDERTKLRHALAIARGRAEAAEAAARAKGDEWAQSIQHATVFRERWEAAEAKLAAIPLDALLYCFRTEIEEREFEDWELYSDAIDIWIDTIVADRLAQLRPSKEAQP